MSLALRLGAGAVAVALFSSASAFAQVPPPAAAPVPGVPATDPAAMAAPVPAAEPIPVAAPAPVAQEASDLDQFVGHIGIGYMGTSSIPAGLNGNDPEEFTAPAIGFRYWMSSKMGIEAGLGLTFGSSSAEVDGISGDGPSHFGFLLHGGLPLALANYRHVSFQVIPFLQLAYGSVSDDVNDLKQSGVRLSLGAKAGSEVFFGFIGLPQLSLSATVGAQFDYVKYSNEVADISSSVSYTTFGTTVQNNPWDIFTGSIAARYYF